MRLSISQVNRLIIWVKGIIVIGGKNTQRDIVRVLSVVLIGGVKEVVLKSGSLGYLLHAQSPSLNTTLLWEQLRKYKYHAQRLLIKRVSSYQMEPVELTQLSRLTLPIVNIKLYDELSSILSDINVKGQKGFGAIISLTEIIVITFNFIDIHAITELGIARWFHKMK